MLNIKSPGMIEKVYTNDLAKGVCFIEYERVVAYIYPLREIASYNEKAIEKVVAKEYIFETYHHADFAYGHKYLSNKTGSIISYGNMYINKYINIMG